MLNSKEVSQLDNKINSLLPVLKARLKNIGWFYSYTIKIILGYQQIVVNTVKCLREIIHCYTYRFSSRKSICYTFLDASYSITIKTICVVFILSRNMFSPYKIISKMFQTTGIIEICSNYLLQTVLSFINRFIK